jgi:MoaA/NifB/PqqE/SkfB family radical SAM enzyme
MLNRYLLKFDLLFRPSRCLSSPLELQLEPTNRCNLTCGVCLRKVKKHEAADMSFEDFKHIIDKFKYLKLVTLHGWGEPLLNENIFDMIRYAKKYHPDIKIDTNLTCLDEDNAEKLVASGLDKIVVSIDGLNSGTYSKYRIGGDFDKVMNNLKLLIKKRKKLKSLKPYITWQFLVFRHNEHEIDNAVKMGRKLGVDHVGITKAFIGDKDWMPLNQE